VTILPNATLKGVSLDQAAAALALDDSYFSAKPYAVFLFQWETKGSQVSKLTNLDWELVKEVCKLQGIEEKQQLLELYAPSSIIVIVAVLDKGSNRAFDAAKIIARRINRIFSIKTEVLDLWSLEDGGSLHNLFTASNAQDIAGKYKVGISVEEGYLHLFAEFLGELNRGGIEGNMQVILDQTVKDGVERGNLAGEDLLLYAERSLGSGYRPAIVQAITLYDHFSPVQPTPRPPFPRDLFPVKPSDLAKLSDCQMSIWSFISQLVYAGNRVGNQGKRNLLICGSSPDDMTEFAYFLAKFFRVYWKSVQFPSQKPLINKILSADLVVIDRWSMQPSDLTLLHPNPVPVLIMTTHEKEEVMSRLRSSREAPDILNSGYEVVSLTGKRTRLGDVVRVEEVPEELRYGGIRERGDNKAV
jgi:hypothetical protein